MSFIDVSHVQESARPIIAQVAEVYIQHLHPWLIGLLVHGSAFKGGNYSWVQRYRFPDLSGQLGVYPGRPIAALGLTGHSAGFGFHRGRPLSVSASLSLDPSSTS